MNRFEVVQKAYGAYIHRSGMHFSRPDSSLALGVAIVASNGRFIGSG
jgi:hypothetical protein